ncbi:MAG: glycosyltransferase family 9 protein [Alphaproteobacteria bacterium]
MRFFKLQDRLQRAFRARRCGPATGVLLVSAGGLGDTVLFSLVVPRLMELAQDGEMVTVLLRSDAAKMAFVMPPGVRIEAVDFKRLRRSLSYRRKVMTRLYRANYRLAISTDYLRHPDLDEALIAAADADEAIAMQPRSWPKHDRALIANRRLYARLFDSGPDHTDKVVRWSNFADWLTGNPAPVPRVRLPDDVLPAPAGDAPDILIQPFSAVAAKQSPVALYRAIIDALPDGTTVALTGAPGDLDTNPAFQELLDLPGVTFDSSTFADLAPKLRAARLVISVDTAAMHLAVATGAPTLCLASAAYVGEIVPYAADITPDNAHFIYQSMDCEGCLGNCIQPLENGMYPCVAAIATDTVTNKVKQLLT